MKYTVKDLERDLFRRNGKYTVMGFSCAVIHVIYLLIFYNIGCFPMVFYNGISALLYIYYGVTCSQGVRYREFFAFFCIEIPLHAILGTLTLGWDFSFMYLIFGLIPAVYFVIVFIENIQHKILLPTILGVFYALLFLVVKIASQNIRPYIVTETSQQYQVFFSYFNTIITYMLLLCYSIIFSFEYNYVQAKLTQENKSLGNFASYDTLTGLLNRRSIDSHLDKIYKEHYHDEEAFSVIMCDIDHFKVVNDTYGHDAGDYILKEVASVISEEVRDNDIVGRWGGEEFLIILNTNKAAAAKLAERVRAAIEEHTFSYRNNSHSITMTFGVSAYHDGNDIPSLIRSADKKLYRGKENGRNQVVS